jgi:diguanylate cyclase (GGDEF)-like protein
MPDAVNNDVSAKLEMLRQRFRDKVVGEFDALDAIARSFLSGQADCQQLDQVYRILHRIAGSAGTFGYSALGEEARRLEVWVKPQVDDCTDGALKPAEISEEFFSHLVSLREMLALSDRQQNETQASAHAAQPDEAPVLVIEPDTSKAEQLMDGLALYGYRVSTIKSLMEWDPASDTQPSVVVIRDDVMLAEASQLPVEFRELPVICIGVSDSYAHRYALAREGAEAFFSDPLNLPLLADHLERLLTDHADAASGRILIVDDDPELREHYQLVLSSGGMEAEGVTGDPSILLPKLSEFRPDIVLMDVQMGSISGPALARMMRFEPEWLSLPIVYLSAESDRELQLDALSKGGDDFLTKPVSDSFLLRTARIRCYRAKQLDKLVSRDSLTGLLKHSLVKAEVAKEHARCHRMHHDSVVAMLDLDHFKKVNDSQGHRAGDLVIKGLANLLRHRLRKTDVIGRYGGEEFIVVLPDCTLERGQTVLKAVCEDFSRIVFEGCAGEFSVTLSAGMAALPDYDHPEEAIEAADRALYERKRAGRNGVTAVGL